MNILLGIFQILLALHPHSLDLERRLTVIA